MRDQSGKEEKEGCLFRRLMDLALAVTIVFFLAPLLLLIAVSIKLTAWGPILFRQERVGKDGQRFQALKFRTMCPDADKRLAEILREDPVRRAEFETYHKLKNDPRVTPLGHWLRRHGLDELPQLWNVIADDMSLVGPRPYLPAELDLVGGAADQILRVRPGITGIWQVSGRNHIPFAKRVEMDVDYVAHRSWWGDVQILVRTIFVVFRGAGGR